MTLVIEVIVGILLAFWLKNKIGVWRNRSNIAKCRDVFLRSTPSDLIHYAIDSEEFAYTRNERMYLLELAVEADEFERQKLAEAIAQNAAGRLLAFMHGKSQPSVMTDLDKLWLEEMENRVAPWRTLIQIFDAAKKPLNDGIRQNMRSALGLKGTTKKTLVPPAMYADGVPYDEYRRQHPLTAEQIEQNRLQLLREFAPEFLNKQKE
jgi:hypothetical protein